MPASPLHRPVLDWYARNARDLPWRAPGAGPWAVLVSEVMLQQTPVARVEPVWREWLRRWPTPGDLAAEAPGAAVRAWGRLGYPRRALRLHEAATAVRDSHGGAIPAAYEDLLALPGVGRYTAAAVASFAFGARHAVVDTNVARVHARALAGVAQAGPTLSRGQVRLAESLLPDAAAAAARWGAAVMELGALVCTARAPRCAACPLAARCAWRRAGRPPAPVVRRRGQQWAGTDRMVRGRLLAAVRAAPEVAAADLGAEWPQDPAQVARCLASLVADGLVEPVAADRYRLPAGR